MRRCGLLLAFVAFAAGFAPAPLPRAGRRPRPAHELVGTWRLPGKVLTITADRFTVDADDRHTEYALAVHPTGRPRAFDLRGISRDRVGWQFEGIFRVEGDTLTLCYVS